MLKAIAVQCWLSWRGMTKTCQINSNVFHMEWAELTHDDDRELRGP